MFRVAIKIERKEQRKHGHKNNNKIKDLSNRELVNFSVRLHKEISPQDEYISKPYKNRAIKTNTTHQIKRAAKKMLASTGAGSN